MTQVVNIPLVGGNYKHDSLPFDRQETINMFPERGGKQSKSRGILRRLPGTADWITIQGSTGLIRGLHVFSNEERLYVARGTALVQVYNYNGDQQVLGTINAGNDRIAMVDNGNQLCVADGTGMWSYESGILSAVTGNAPVNTKVLEYIDGYIFGFGISEGKSGRFQHSNLNDCTTWDALDTYTAEGSPDRLVTLVALNRQLWVMGEKSFEVWYNRGGNNSTTGATWARIDGTFTEIGCASRDSVATIGARMFWLGSSKDGQNIIWASGEGYQPMRISDKAMETTISEMETISDAWGFGYQYLGHYFYGITFPSEDKTYLYVISEGEWVRWAYKDPDTGVQHRVKFLTAAYFGRDNVVGDYQNGNVYKLQKTTYKDTWERYFAYVHSLNKLISWYSLFIDIETGKGVLEGQGSDPLIQIRWSDDGGRIFGNWHQMGIGKRGKYFIRPIIRMMGQSRTRVYHIRSSEPIPISIQDNAVAEIEVDDL